jgi:dTDP-4-amino-4,6-dideoxygalactose transaminase
MRNFGFAGYDNVVYPGTNGKMSEIAAAMGLTNLTIIDDVVAGNRATLDRYVAAFAPIDGVQLLQPDEVSSSNCQYIVAMVEPGAEARDEMLARLHDTGILARKYFWPGIHRMQPYAAAGLDRDLPATDYVADRVLVLPGGPSIDEHVPFAIADIVEKVMHDD